MSTKRTVHGLAATLMLLVGVSGIGTPVASAATPACGANCISVFSRELGTYAHPNFVEDVLGGEATIGQPVGLKQASGSDPSEDILPRGGSLADFFAAGMVSAEVNSHYAGMRAVQQVYAPFGVPTDLCVGLATVAYQNEGLTLQPCSTPGTTVWIIDTADSPATAPTYFPIVSGSTTDFTHPFAMIIHGNPAHKRFPQIKVQRLRGNPAHVRYSQLWGANASN